MRKLRHTRVAQSQPGIPQTFPVAPRHPCTRTSIHSPSSAHADPGGSRAGAGWHAEPGSKGTAHKPVRGAWPPGTVTSSVPIRKVLASVSPAWFPGEVT